MKKRSFIALIALFLLAFCITACGEDKSDEIILEDSKQTVVEKDSSHEDSDQDSVAADDEDSDEKDSEDGESDDATLSEDDTTDADEDDTTAEETRTDATTEETEVVPAPCSLCGKSVDCETYEVDGKTYLVCDYCYPEFADAFGLED